jgi:hypothetical protein
MRPALLASLTLALAVAAHVAPARAQDAPEPRRLTYDATAGGKSCPDESFLRTVVASHLGGRDPFTAEGKRRISVTIRRKGTRFSGVVEEYDEGGARLGEPREMTDTNCTSLAETMGTIILTWIVPVRLPHAPEAPPAKPDAAPQSKPEPALELPPPESDPELPPPEPAPKPKSPPAPPRPRIQVEAGPLVSFRKLPGTAAFGLAGSVGVRWSMFSIALGMQGEFPSSTTITNPPSTVRASLIVGTLAPCVRWRWLIGCVPFAAGALTADGSGIYRAERRVYAYGAGGARVGAELPLGSEWLGLQLAGDVVVPFSAQILTYRLADVWTAPRVGFSLSARLVASF